jgi:hypothetical protein
MSVIPVSKEAEVGVSQSEANCGQKWRTHLKNELKQKRAGGMV